MIFERLPYTILYQVLLNLNTEDYLRLRLVNKEFYNLVTPTIYRDIRYLPSKVVLRKFICAEAEKLDLLINTLIQNPHLTTYVESLVISIPIDSIQKGKLECMIKCCSNLRRLLLLFQIEGDFSILNVQTSNIIRTNAPVKELIIDKRVSFDDLDFELQIEKLSIWNTNYKWVNSLLRHLIDKQAFHQLRELTVKLKIGDQCCEFVELINGLLTKNVSFQLILEECNEIPFLRCIQSLLMPKMRRFAIVYNGSDFSLAITELIKKIDWDCTRVFVHINGVVSQGDLIMYDNLPLSLSVRGWATNVSLTGISYLSGLNNSSEIVNAVEPLDVNVWNKENVLSVGNDGLWELFT